MKFDLARLREMGVAIISILIALIYTLHKKINERQKSAKKGGETWLAFTWVFAGAAAPPLLPPLGFICSVSEANQD